jgi:hypothetical protein
VIKSGMMRWAGHVAPMVEMRNAHKILVTKCEGKKACERPILLMRIILK